MNANFRIYLQAIEALRDELKPSPLADELVKLELLQLESESDLPQFVTDAMSRIRKDKVARRRLKEIVDNLTKERGYTPLAGKSLAIRLGPLMRCWKNPSHPRRKLIRTGQTCRMCGAKLVHANQTSVSTGGDNA